MTLEKSDGWVTSGPEAVGLWVTTARSGKKNLDRTQCFRKRKCFKRGVFKQEKRSCLKLVSKIEKMLNVWVTP